MKRLIFSALLGSIVTLSFGQGSSNTGLVKMKKPVCVGDGYAIVAPGSSTSTYVNNNGQSSSTGSSRAVTTTELGSAGNAFTILDGSINRVASNQALNTVTFIHRADPAVLPATNIGQFVYDISTDGGDNWDINYGPLNPSGNNQTEAGRYPNAVIYNPQGNTNPANGYLAYLGSWLPFAATGSDWDGFFSGVARLNNNSSTFTETLYAPANSDVYIARGMSNGIPGVFWTVDWRYDGTNFSDILLYRGIWNDLTKDVDWSLYRTFSPNHDISVDGTAQATALNMAFDPTGRYGYIVFSGDIVAGGNGVLEPIVYYTADGGITWSNAEQISLSSIDLIQNNLTDSLIDIPTTGFDIDIAVDINGNPHILVVIGSNGPTDPYSIASGQGLNIYDVTRSGNNACPWTAIHVSEIETFRGTFGVDVPEDNRPQTSISPDGTKVVFGWLDSDGAATSGENNQPNFFTRAYNINTGLATEVTNWTLGDPIWEGGALFASLAPTSLQAGNTLKIPTVFAQLDPSTGDPENPATFHYIQNIQYTNAEFTEDVEAPVIVLNGNSPLTIVQNSTYNEPGATATDNVGVGAVTVTGTVNTAVVGSYNVVYTVTDNAGNVACEVTRRVNVVAAPDNTNPVVTLIGPSTITVDVCGYYNEQGATATDNVDGNISANVTNNGNNVPFGTLLTPGTVGTYTITYTVTDGAGNTGTATRTINIVDQGPVITLPAGNAITIEVCDPFVIPGATAFDNCDGFVNVTTSGNVDSLTAGTYTVTYTATDGNNNTSTATLTVTVSADQTPPTITLTGASTVYVYLGTQYVDQLPTVSDCSGVASVTSNESTAVDESSYGTYTVSYIATDNNGLKDTAFRTVIVNTEPDPRFTYVANGLTVLFTDASLYGPTSWRWEFGDPNNLSSTARTTSFVYPAAGSYEVCLTSRNQFNLPPFNKPAKETCETINLTVGINEVALERSISVYPNPTSGNFTINIKDLSFENMSVKVFNMIGERVLANDYSKVQAQSLIDLNIGGNASGIYMIQISTEQGVVTKRINLQNGF